MRVFQALLALYPTSFRDEYRREMMLALADRLRAASGPLERVLIWLEAISGVLTEAPKEQLSMLIQDLRYAIRSLRKNPGFAFVAILTLALGIGASTTVFSVVDALLLRPLPYPKADRLVMIWEGKRDIVLKENLVSPADVLDWRSRTQTLERIAMFRLDRVALTGSGEPIELQAQTVNRDFFPALGVTPHRGRWPTPAEDAPGAPPVVVISYRLWQQKFGGDEAMLGNGSDSNRNYAARFSVHGK